MDPAVRRRAQDEIFDHLARPVVVTPPGGQPINVEGLWETLDSTEVGDVERAPRRVQGRRRIVIRRRELGTAGLPTDTVIQEASGETWQVHGIAQDDGTDIRAWVIALGRDTDTSGPGGA